MSPRLYRVIEDEDGQGWKKHPNQYIYFAVEYIEEMFELAKKSEGTIEQEITQMPWGERLFYMKDPFGNPICFVDQSTLFMGWD